MREDTPCSSYSGPEYHYRVVYKLYSGDYHLTTPVKSEEEAQDHVDFMLERPDRYEYAHIERKPKADWERV